VERETTPAKLYIIFPLQAVGTHGTEIAPGSDVIEKDLYNGCGIHGVSLPLLISVSYSIAARPVCLHIAAQLRAAGIDKRLGDIG
jgi:hypothetical protein